jgi:hypothetical protein
VKHHMRKRDTTRRCFICTNLGHLSMNCMNTRIMEDEKKSKAYNIRKQIKWQWIPKSSENASPSHETDVTQELGDSSIST